MNLTLCKFSVWIITIRGIIQAISEHVIAEDALAGRDKGIGVEEATDCGIVITGLEIIESQLLDSLFAMVAFFCAGIARRYPCCYVEFNMSCHNSVFGQRAVPVFGLTLFLAKRHSFYSTTN